jgi:hypothetical protein
MLKQNYEKNMKLGIDAETKYLPYLHKHIDSNLTKTRYKYDEIDFESENCLVELKTRSCASFDYKDTIVGYNKVERALKENKKCYFVFAFTNGLYCWEFDKEDRDVFDIKINCKTIDPNRMKEHSLIPIKKLKCLESFCLIKLP